MKRHFAIISIGVLMALGPLFVFPREEWNWILLAGVSMGFIGRWILNRRFLPMTPIDGALGLLLTMAFAGVFIIRDVGESAGKLAGFVYGIAIFYALVDVLRTPKKVKVAVVLFLASGLAVAVVGTMGRIDYHESFLLSVEQKLPKIPRWNLSFQGAESGVNPNALGGVVLLFIPLGLIQVRLLARRNPGYAPHWIRITGLAGIAVLLAAQTLAILLSISFGTWFSLAVALWLMGEWKRPMRFAVAGMFLCLTVIFFLKTDVRNQNPSKGILGTIDNSARSRLGFWNHGLAVVKDHPVFGIGMGQLRFTPKFVYETAHAHNQFLHTAAELGIPGVIAYIAILIGVFWMTGEVRKSTLPEWMRLTSRGLGTGIFAFTLFGIGDAIPLGAKPGIFFWISLAIITSIFLYRRNSGSLTSAKNEAP